MIEIDSGLLLYIIVYFVKQDDVSVVDIIFNEKN